MEENTPVKTDEKKPYETLLILLLIVSAALSGVCGYLSADASNSAGDANEASIKAQNEALSLYNIANQQIQNDRNIIMEADVHWFYADKYQRLTEYAYAEQQNALEIANAAYDSYAENYTVGTPTNQQMWLLSYYQISWQDYTDKYKIYNDSAYAMFTEYDLTKWVLETTEASNNGNITYELYNVTSDADTAIFWAAFEDYENWTYRPYYAQLSNSTQNATSAQQFDENAKSYLMSTVMLGISATIAAIALSVEYKSSRKYLIIVTAIVTAVAAIYALLTLM